MGAAGTIVSSTRALARDSVHAHVAQIRTIALAGDNAAGAMLPTYGNRFDLLEGSDAFVQRLVTDIGAASHQVNFSTYALHPGAPGSKVQSVVDALIERARAGVRVTGIIDQVGSGLLIPGAKRIQRDAFVGELRGNGIDILVKRLTPTRGGVDDARFAVDHRKVYEIDGHVSYQGGMNLVDAWLPWHDVMLRTEGPAAAQAGALLAGRWRDLGGTVDDVRMAVLEAGLRRPVDDARHATLQLSNGSRHRRELTEQFIADASGARSRLWIANPYLSDPEVMEPIVEAARQGRDVRLLLAPKVQGGGQVQDVFTDPLRRAWAYKIAEAGGQVIVVPEFSHAKVWLADDAVGVGAFNLDLMSTKRNYENAVRTTDPAAIAAVEAMFLRQERRGAVATEDVVAGWRTVARVRDRLGLKY